MTQHKSLYARACQGTLLMQVAVELPARVGPAPEAHWCWQAAAAMQSLELAIAYFALAESLPRHA